MSKWSRWLIPGEGVCVIFAANYEPMEEFRLVKRWLHIELNVPLKRTENKWLGSRSAPFCHLHLFSSPSHLAFPTYPAAFHAQLSPAARGVFCARSLAPFHFIFNSVHCNHRFLNGNTNPLCQRGRFPPCTKLIPVPHHPITPPHWLKQPAFSGAAGFFSLLFFF